MGFLADRTLRWFSRARRMMARATELRSSSDAGLGKHEAEEEGSTRGMVGVEGAVGRGRGGWGGETAVGEKKGTG
jgi:hypothetical protein